MVDGKKVKTTRIIRKAVVKNKVNPRVAERRAWAKFGAAAKDGPGPQSDTTTVGENIEMNPRQNFRLQEQEQGSTAELEKKKAELVKATVTCRICKGEHFTARCPFKGTMAPEGEPAVGEPVADPMAEVSMGGAGGGGKSSYVPPHLRGAGGGERTGEKMGGKYERDDLATLRVTNVSARMDF